MARLFLTVFFSCSFFLTEAQQISVASFQLLENDLDARVNHPIRDQNGELCAIIKVVTTQTGFEWEPDGLGIVAAERKTGEYWLYVPRGAQRVTIKHDQLGILRNFRYPLAITAASVYEMVLTTAEVEVVVREREIESQWIAISSNPEGATVFINDLQVGSTPFSRQYPEGEYTFRVELPRYHPEAGRIALSGDREMLHFDMRPRFGDISVTSSPEDGMMIFLNDENTGEVTPATLREVVSGTHTIRLSSQWYQPAARQVTVSDNQTVSVDFEMEPAYANIAIRTGPPAEILVDGDRVGHGSYTSRMLAGVYEVTASLDRHYPGRQQLRVEAGRDQEITLELRPRTGHLDVTSIPFHARIMIDDKEHGTTPNTISDLLIGEYTLSLSLEGYGTVTERVTITEGQATEISKTLPEGMEVTIISSPAGAELTINDVSFGKTPFTGELAFGSHQVKLVHGQEVVEETINVRQGGEQRWQFDVSGFGTPVVEVTNPRTGRVWMDRNLGANRAATRSTDAQAYGDLYQWGRAADGHQLRTSGTTSSLSSSNAPGHGNLILAPDSPYDWRSPQNDNLWHGVNGINNPCPPGYRLPTDVEWDEERRSWSTNNAAGAFGSPLKLPVAGGRRRGGSLYVVGSNGGYWSSTVVGAYSRGLGFGFDDARMGSYGRASGFSVRCIKD